VSLISESAVTTSTTTLVNITFVPDGKTIAVESGQTVLHAARKAGIHIDAPCGEQGRCGKCRVRLLEGMLAPLTAEETALLKPAELAEGVRLSCEAVLTDHAVIDVPESSRNLAHRKGAAELRRAVTLAPMTRKVCVTVPQPSIESGDLRDDLTRLRAVTPGVTGVCLEAVRELHDAIVAGNATVTLTLYGDHLIDVEPGDVLSNHYGVALDIGTTTVVGYLMDLGTGLELGIQSHPNPQASYGADVISRIEYAQNNPAHTEALRQSVTSAVNTILRGLAESAQIDVNSIYELVMVGNTCMSHLFLGIDPVSLGHAPYTPVITDSMEMPAADLGLAMHPRGRVRTLPNIAGFVGADTVGVLAAGDLEKLSGLHAAVDIGTNAEVLVSVNGKVIACSTAAGPAFEGAKISHGMRAQPGAIDGVSIGQDLFIHTIGDKPARGICGSGIIDAIGELVRVGMLESSGRFADTDDVTHLPEPLRARLTEEGVVLAWAAESATGHDILLTQRDVREVQLVKAAIYAGVVTLLEKLGHRPEELDSLMIAGAFGTYISKEHALGIGLIPNIDVDKLVFLGNAAGIGAKMALLSREEYQTVCGNARAVGYVELAGDEIFRDNFAMAMMLAPGCDG
jgi:uncharacterized 2Fe-2S/4Fe-4S cluster protein (DUF4445 family)